MAIKDEFSWRGLIAGGAAATLIVAAGAVQAADAPASASEQELAEVVITGSSIRGAALVGSNLITVGREDIEASGAQTLQ